MNLKRRLLSDATRAEKKMAIEYVWMYGIYVCMDACKYV